MEGMLDSTFINLGVDGANGGIDRPLIMTEPVANLGYSRKSKALAFVEEAILNTCSDDGTTI